MNQKSKTIVFFGSGPVAAKALQLLSENFNVEAVITKPKPEHHRGSFPTIEMAESLGMKVLTASNRSELKTLISTQEFKSDIAVLIDYGIIVDQPIIDSFPLGIVNSHFSLLPEWRGADPITFSILSGQGETGVSLMLLVEAMDEGPLLAQSPFKIEKDMTTPALTEKLIELSDALLNNILPEYIQGHVQPFDQIEASIAQVESPSYSRRLTKLDGKLDWQKSAEALEREIRAFADWPKSYTEITGSQIVITQAHATDDSGNPGTIWINNKQFGIYCGEGLLVVDKLKPSGKQEMSTEAYLAGHKLEQA